MSAQIGAIARYIVPLCASQSRQSGLGLPLSRDDVPESDRLLVRLEHFDAAIIARALSIQERQEMPAIISRVRPWLIRLETALNDDAAIVAGHATEIDATPKEISDG
jgi:hypothetical protein